MRVVKALLSTAAVAAVGWVLINGPAASYRSLLGNVNRLMPGAGDKIDPEGSLNVHRDEFDTNIHQAEASLVELKAVSQDNDKKRSTLAAKIKYNNMLLPEGRALFAKAAGKPVEWIGVVYKTAELHTQLSSLYNETRALEEALAEDNALATTIEENIANMAAVRSRLTAARDRIVSQIALYHVNKLVGDYHSILDEGQSVLRSYNTIASNSAAVVKTVRTGSELKQDREQIDSSKGQVPNTEFESWLAEATPSQEALSAQ